MSGHNRENQADRLRRRLEERDERIKKQTRQKLSPFTLVSIAIILVVLFIFRGNI
ncbi:MAG: hypothetical protein FWB74_01345 [Defluviitaleaceae bacterium]|nr:hypothetical protein [Defluviitaleaceae bacterium]